MLKIKYLNEKTSYNISFKKIGSHIVQITGDFPVKEKGFICFRVENDEDSWDYSNYKTIYREIEGGVQFSDDGSVYSEPAIEVFFRAGNGGRLEGETCQQAKEYTSLIVPDPVPEDNYVFKGWEPEIPKSGKIDDSITFLAVFQYVPTLSEVKNAKRSEIGAAYEHILAQGFNAMLSTGEEHFPLTQTDITFLMGKQLEMAGNTAEQISYQDSEGHCKFYSREDMQIIVGSALQFANYQTTYRNNLLEWVEMCQTSEEVGRIVYGSNIPVEYQNDVYKSYLTLMEGK